MQFFAAPLTKNDLLSLQKKEGDYCKVTADIAQKLIVVAPDLHADGEKILLEKGSRSDDIWGGGINLVNREIDATAVLNLRPKLDNSSLEILDPARRTAFLQIIRDFFACLWD